MAGEKRYYIVQNGTQQGPMSLQAIRQVNFNFRNTDVWTPGFADWRRINSLAELDQALGYLAPAGASSTVFASSSVSSGVGDPVLEAGYQYGSVARRFVVEVIDGFLFMLLIGRLQDTHWFLAYLLFVALYAAVCYHFLGGTLGHYLMGLKVVSSIDASDVKAPLKAVGRELAKSFCIWTILPSFWLLFDPRRQNTYDKICDTVVVSKLRSDAYNI